MLISPHVAQRAYTFFEGGCQRRTSLIERSELKDSSEAIQRRAFHQRASCGHLQHEWRCTERLIDRCWGWDCWQGVIIALLSYAAYVAMRKMCLWRSLTTHFQNPRTDRKLETRCPCPAKMIMISRKLIFSNLIYSCITDQLSDTLLFSYQYRK